MKDTSSIFSEWLVIRCQQGDKEAFNLLVRQWQAVILSRAFWYCKDKLAAKDIAQETWTSILKGIHNLRDPARFPVWMNQIVYRKSVDWIRGEQRDRNLNKKDIEETLHSQDESSTDRISLVMREVASLPLEAKTILTLFYLNEHSLHEISEILSIPVGTVKSRLFYAREYLKKQLKEHDHEKEL